jgi:phosphoribosyl 1,2-cyclic phosphodiesterase
MEKQFLLKFRGVRGSIPVPGKSTLKYGGNTTCIELRINNNLIIVDSGTGIINLGYELMKEYSKDFKPIKAIILFTHVHLDHVIGLPFFVPIYIGSTELNIYGPRYYNQDFKKSLSMCMQSPLFPVEFEDVQSNCIVNNIKEGEFIIINDSSKPELDNVFRPSKKSDENSIKIYAYQSYAHPNDGVLAYRFEYNNKKVVIATDIEGYKTPDVRLSKFSKDVDLLIADAQYTEEEYQNTQGFGHSTVDMAIDLAKSANAKNLILFHHDPRHNDEKLDDIYEYSKKLFPNCKMAIEEETIDILKL